jgi:ABC-type polysaccharide/polyol phosphate transport system ATPase subunit
MQRIVVEDIAKRFKIGFKKRQTALSRLASLFSGREPKKIIWALKEVSFKAEEGEIIGIIGKNGSGKSTLLRVIAGIYKCNKGKVKTNGKIISLINLNVGMQQRLTMKDNIYLCCSLFGLSQKTIKQRFNSVLKFSELQNFLNTKIYQFSEGMKQRLAFSIAIHCNPEILLLDEVFEVGDKEFKIKSANKIKELVKKGATVLLVSHELWMIEKYCDRIIWLDKGRILEKGNTRELAVKYKKTS